MKNILLIALFLFSIKATSQKLQSLTVHHTDNTTTHYTGKLKYNYDGFIDSFLFVKGKSKIEKSLNNIKSIYTKDGVNYIVKKYKGNLYAFKSEIIGDLSLFSNKNDYYFENEEIGFKQIPYKQRGDYKFGVFNVGQIIVFVNKCKALQNYLDENSNTITVKKLKLVVTEFNNCNLEKDLQISDQAIERANYSKEVITYGISIGNTFLNSNYSGISVDTDIKTSTLSFGAILYFRPRLLDEKLMYNFSCQYIPKSKSKVSTEDYYVDVVQSYFTAQLGINYLFFKNNKKLNPYVGISGGFNFNIDTSVLLRNTTFGAPTKSFGGKSVLIYNLNAGCLINVLNQDFDINLSYLPKSKFTLISQSLDQNYAHYHLNGVGVKITYIF